MAITKSCNGYLHNGEQVPIENFSWKKKSSGKRNSICKACHKKSSHDHYVVNKESYDITRDTRRAAGLVDRNAEKKRARERCAPYTIKIVIAKSIGMTATGWVPMFLVWLYTDMLIIKKEGEMTITLDKDKFESIGEYPDIEFMKPEVHQTPEPAPMHPDFANLTPMEQMFYESENIRRRLRNGEIDNKTAHAEAKTITIQTLIAVSQMSHDKAKAAGQLDRRQILFEASVPILQLQEVPYASV